MYIRNLNKTTCFNMYIRKLPNELDVIKQKHMISMSIKNLRLFVLAAWQALREVFPRVILRGCVFHWTQCVYRMVLRLGLNATYLAAGDTYAFIRKLLALPFLSAEHRSFPGSRYPLRPGRKRRGRQAGGVRGGHVGKWSNLETNGLVSLPRECPHE